MLNENLIFLFLNQNICCGYSKEPSQWDGSFEHPKHLLKLICKKIFTILRWNFLFDGYGNNTILCSKGLDLCALIQRYGRKSFLWDICYTYDYGTYTVKVFLHISSAKISLIMCLLGENLILLHANNKGACLITTFLLVLSKLCNRQNFNIIPASPSWVEAYIYIYKFHWIYCLNLRNICRPFCHLTSWWILPTVYAMAIWRVFVGISKFHWMLPLF